MTAKTAKQETKTSAMAGLLNQTSKSLRLGDIATGKVLEVGKNSVFIDLGSAGTGVLLGREIKENKALIKALKPGQEISAMVIETENNNGQIELSLQAATQEKAWDTLRDLLHKQETVTVKVVAANRGGLMIELKGVSGFLPVSQLAYEHYPRVENGDKNMILQELNKFVNKELPVRVIDADPSQQKLIVSEKATQEGKIKEALTQFKVGDLVEGVISGVVDFGAFVKFSLPDSPDKGESKTASQEKTMEGLIHISEIDWQLIEDPRQILHVGDKVTAKIIGLDNDRLSLSLKALKQDPWQEIAAKYQVGQDVTGEVTKINPFGAFVKLDKDIHGLAHVSDFKSIDAMNEEIKTGQQYSFKILSIEASAHKMALSLVRPETAAQPASAPEDDSPKTE